MNADHYGCTWKEEMKNMSWTQMKYILAYIIISEKKKHYIHLL